MKATELLRLLTSGDTVSLAAWYGDPLPCEAANAWLTTFLGSLHGPGASVRRHFNSRLAEMIARYWNAQDIRMSYENLTATAANTADRARLELCYGQLLLARKCHPAWQHLDAGFAQAALLFEPNDYFVVLKRHDALKQLVLSTTGAEAATLDVLLKEADVIRQLRGGRSGTGRPDSRHQDTVD